MLFRSLAGLTSSSTVTGVHVYAAALHDRRFRQMEGGLPEKYREEQELERQRDVHDDLITRGLSIITDSYLDQGERRCREAGGPFARRSLEGKNYRELAREANSGGYDLLVLGALGVGAIEGSRVGSVGQRVVRDFQKVSLLRVDLLGLARTHAECRGVEAPDVVDQPGRECIALARLVRRGMVEGFGGEAFVRDTADAAPIVPQQGPERVGVARAGQPPSVSNDGYPGPVRHRNHAPRGNCSIRCSNIAHNRPSSHETEVVCPVRGFPN